MRSLALLASFVACFALAGLALAATTYGITAAHEKQRLSTQFDEFLAERSYALEVEILAVFEALYSLKALYDASDDVTREEFATFVREALARHPSIRAMKWIPRVPAGARGAHEASGRAEGLPEYGIKDCLDQGRIVPAPRRAEYFPVFFVEPYEGNEGALGFDVGSHPARRAALDRAMETGQVTVERICMVADAGRVINPITASGQVEGGLQQVLGFAHCEEMVYDDDGRLVNPRLGPYHIYKANEMPELDVFFVQTEEPSGPFGAKSVSELPMDGIAPAMADAIYDATGVWMREVPFTPERVWRALRENER